MRDISALSSMVLNSGHPLYMSRRRESSFTETSAEPRLNQPGRLKRLCIHENTQGMARILVISLLFPRAAGREPMCIRLISSSGVAVCQNSINPGVSNISPRYILCAVADIASIALRHAAGISAFAFAGDDA